jgi:hypothetical protein
LSFESKCVVRSTFFSIVSASAFILLQNVCYFSEISKSTAFFLYFSKLYLRFLLESIYPKLQKNSSFPKSLENLFPFPPVKTQK